MHHSQRPRVIPCLLLRNTGLVKTIKFKDPTYLGDPRNIVKIFNDKEADELVLLDITASRENRPPRLPLIAEIVSECFMPMGYGGGIRTVEQAEKIIAIGVEKIVVNTAAVENPRLIADLAKALGSQSVVVSIDARRKFLGRYEVCTRGGQQHTKLDPAAWARQAAEAGAGEIFLNSIDCDGTMSGYDVELIKAVVQAVNIPVIACGGAATVADFGRAVQTGGASAVAAGSMFVFQGRHRAVLVSFPEPRELQQVFCG